MQSAISPMLVGAPIRLNPQSAMRNMQIRFTRSNLELRGHRNGLEIGPRSSRWLHSAPLVAQVPNPPTKWAIEG
eukprot:13652968-Alexandrium_andersonii.AAC.1